MALRLSLPGNPDPTLPLSKIDPILPDDGGAVWLVDVAHPAAAWPAGVPANGASIPNLVSLQPECGIDGLTPPPLSYVTDGLITGPIGLVERTEKLGLHVIMSQTAQGDYYTHTSSKYYARIENFKVGVTTTPFSTWLYGTDGSDGAWQHSWYQSIWLLPTRAALTGKSQYWVAELAVSASRHHTALVANPDIASSSAHLPASGSGVRAGSIRNVAVGAPRFNAAASTGRFGTNPTGANGMIATAFEQGHHTSANLLTTAKEANPSMGFYRSYLEDLTVSGRTFEEVAALDQELFTIDCLTEGGRFYDDEYTSPATII